MSPARPKGESNQTKQACLYLCEAMARWQEEKLWCQLIKATRESAGSLQADIRSYVLSRAAAGLEICDPAKVLPVLSDSFAASLAIPDSEQETKQELQTSILNDMFRINETKAELLLPRAQMDVQVRIRRTILLEAIGTKRFNRALELLKRTTLGEQFPYEEATQLILALPAERSVDRQDVLTTAIASYDDSHMFCVGCNDLATMIERVWKIMPAAQVLDAIQEVFDAADRNQPPMALGKGLSFSNEYEYRVYEIMPILRVLDPAEADRILRSTQISQGGNFASTTEPLNPSTNLSSQPQGASASEPVPAPLNMQVSKQIAFSGAYGTTVAELSRMAHQNARQAIASAVSLPNSANSNGPETAWPGSAGTVFPRQEALLAIAEIASKGNPSAARDALQEMLKSIADVNPLRQIDFCVDGMRIALQIGEDDLAWKAFAVGMDQVEKLKTKDTDSDDPNTGFKPWWPSTNAASRLLVAAARISPQNAIDAAKQINDAELRTIVELRLADSQLGVLDRSVTMVRKKSLKDSWTMEGADQ